MIALLLAKEYYCLYGRQHGLICVWFYAEFTCLSLCCAKVSECFMVNATPQPHVFFAVSSSFLLTVPRSLVPSMISSTTCAIPCDSLRVPCDDCISMVPTRSSSACARRPSWSSTRQLPVTVSLFLLRMVGCPLSSLSQGRRLQGCHLQCRRLNYRREVGNFYASSGVLS